MEYDKEADEYICPNKKRLSYSYASKYTTENGYVTSRKVYQCESCEGCSYRNECHASKYDRRIRVSHKLNEQNQKATELITTDEGILLRMNRSIQAGFSVQTVSDERKSKDGNSIFPHNFCIQCGKTL